VTIPRGAQATAPRTHPRHDDGERQILDEGIRGGGSGQAAFLAHAGLKINTRRTRTWGLPVNRPYSDAGGLRNNTHVSIVYSEP